MTITTVALLAVILLRLLHRFARPVSAPPSKVELIVTASFLNDQQDTAIKLHNTSLRHHSLALGTDRSSTCLSSDLKDSSSCLAMGRSCTDSTLFYTPQSSEDQEFAPLLRVQPLHLLQNQSLPGPLWQEVAIAADKVYIAKTSAGDDWVLGQGSYAKVRSYSTCLANVAECMCAVLCIATGQGVSSSCYSGVVTSWDRAHVSNAAASVTSLSCV